VAVDPSEPATRVAELLAAGAVAHFDPGHGRLMKQRVTLAPATADECHQYMVEVARLLGPVDLDAVADRCRRLRQDLGLPARLWTAGHLGQILVATVRDHDRPAEAAVPALLAIATDPATRSPARLSCPGPWWEAPTTLQDAHDGSTGSADGRTGTSELVSLERRLAETDGARGAPLRAPPSQPVDPHGHIVGHDRLGGILHEYTHAA